MRSVHTQQEFHSVPRQEFRRFFQPSRLVICVLPDKHLRRVNLITLCFSMYCSYKPPMMAFSIFKGAYSHELIQDAEHCVLCVPGESLASAALLCGTKSGKTVDKVSEAGLTLVHSEKAPVPGIAEAIANVELRIVSRSPTGDHVTAFGEVLKFGVNQQNHERCLLSVGPQHEGYKVLAKKGIHRIGVVQ